MLPRSPVYILCLLSILHLGTTFIIKEDGKEVGRWEETDGKTGTQIIENSKPAKNTTPQPVHDTAYIHQQMSQPMADQAAEAPPVLPGKIEEWKVSGKIFDLITLKSVPDAEIKLTGSGRIFAAKVFPTGGFSVRVPALEAGNYTFQVIPPKGYQLRTYISKTNNFSALPLETRHKMWSSVFFHAVGDDLVSGNFYDWNIALLPETLKLPAKK